jgi:hypothetical protein
VRSWSYPSLGFASSLFVEAQISRAARSGNHLGAENSYKPEAAADQDGWQDF